MKCVVRLIAEVGWSISGMDREERECGKLVFCFKDGFMRAILYLCFAPVRPLEFVTYQSVSKPFACFMQLQREESADFKPFLGCWDLIPIALPRVCLNVGV